MWFEMWASEIGTCRLCMYPATGQWSNSCWAVQRVLPKIISHWQLTNQNLCTNSPAFYDAGICWIFGLWVYTLRPNLFASTPTRAASGSCGGNMTWVIANLCLQFNIARCLLFRFGTYCTDQGKTSTGTITGLGSKDGEKYEAFMS